MAAGGELGPWTLALKTEKGPEAGNAVVSTGCRKQRNKLFLEPLERNVPVLHLGLHPGSSASHVRSTEL